MSERSGRPRSSCARLGARAALLTGLGAGLWLLGQSGAAADELVVPAVVQHATSASSDAGVRVGERVPEPALHAPEAAEPATDAIGSLAVAVIDDRPGLDAGRPSIREVAATAVESAAGLVPKVSSGVPVIRALDPAPEPTIPLPLPRESVLPDGGEVGGTLEPVGSIRGAAVPGRPPAAPDVVQAVRSPGLVHPPGAAVVPSTEPAAPAGTPASWHPPALPSASPSTAVCSGAAAGDQTPAELSAIVPGVPAAAGVPAGGGDQRVVTLAFDPSFSPD